MILLQKELDIASHLARRAGELVLKHYHTDFAVSYKDHFGDPVTAADREANQLIVEGLRDAFPQDAILAEESPEDLERLQKPRLWCVDPLDGTREFVDKNGQFVVMIGLAVHGEAVLGVVYQPTEDLLWCGSGHTAYEQRGSIQHRLSPSTAATATGATLVVSRSHQSKTVARIANAVGVGRQWPLGSVGLKVAQIAAGRADAYVSISNQTHEWDACAPEAIIRAAGGLMTDVLGEPLRYNKRVPNTPNGLLASNGLLHTTLVNAVSEQLTATKR